MRRDSTHYNTSELSNCLFPKDSRMFYIRRYGLKLENTRVFERQRCILYRLNTKRCSFRYWAMAGSIEI